MISGHHNNWRSTVFKYILNKPIAVILACACLVIIFGVGILQIQKDPSVDAFVSSQHPIAATRDRAKELFGLEDPIIVGFSTAIGESVYTPDTLEAFRSFERDVRQLPNVQKHGLVSILQESAISGKNGDLDVDRILEPGIITDETAKNAHQRLLSMPMMVGLLGSASGDMVTMIVPVDDANNATATYARIRELANNVSSGAGEKIDVHVAGVAAMNGRLAHMVDTDTRRLIPLAILTALVLIYGALRRWKGLVGPLLVIIGSAAIGIGCMGWLDARYYLITTALPVIIMAISIADSLHISIVYMRERELKPDHSEKSTMLRTLSHVSKPITLTTVTTIAGFIGLALGSSMVPIQEFGMFAAIGVFAAWVLSLTLLPCVILLLRLSPNVDDLTVQNREIDRWLSKVTTTAFERPVQYIFGLCAIICTFAIMASFATFDYERKLYFPESDPVRISDLEINDRLAGLNFLDVVVSADDEGGLLTPQSLQALKSLQVELSNLPHIEQVTGIVDYISLMHEALADEKNALPSKPNAGAQYMFLYEASGDPGDFDEEIDYSQSNTLIRGQLRTDQFSAVSETVAKTLALLGDWEKQSNLSAEISGRVAVNYSWMEQLSDSHFKSVGLAVILVFFAALLSFRAILPALLTLIPVLTGVMFTYAIMGASGVSIAPATSMTAAIATGLGVDFAVHLISEFQHAQRNGKTGLSALEGSYLVVARACTFSALALGVGLAVICISTAPPLRWFGGLVAAGALGSLIGAILILPAIFSVLSRFQITPQLEGISP